MRGAVLLNTRKRIIVALAHSVAFLALASFVTGPVRPFRMTAPPPAWIMPAVFLLVSAILAALTAFSGASLERIYFAFCTTSAVFGLARQILGDPPMHVAVYIRIAMLSCAVATGILMLRQTDRPGVDVSGLPDQG